MRSTNRNPSVYGGSIKKIFLYIITSIFISSASAQLMDNFVPHHAASHLAGGSDPITGLSTVQYYEKHTVTEGEVTTGIINLTTGTYTVGNNSLMVFLQRVLMANVDDYTETDSDTVTFKSGYLSKNDIVIFRWMK